MAAEEAARLQDGDHVGRGPMPRLEYPRMSSHRRVPGGARAQREVIDSTESRPARITYDRDAERPIEGDASR